jgi:hypothetical protein
MRLVRPALVLLAIAALAAVLSACTNFVPGSLGGTQPQGVGAVHVRFSACLQSTGTPFCSATNRSGEAQAFVALAVPSGASAPATITAEPSPGAPVVTLSRNREVAERLAEQEAAGNVHEWPPAGDEIVGYLSDVYTELEGQEAEWTIDAPFGLPAAADGSPFAGPFIVALGGGWRVVDESHSADRPIECTESISDTDCGLEEEAELGVSDLKVRGGSATAAAGGKASVPFTLDFASTAESPPGFSLSATSSLPGAAAAPTESSYSAAALDAETHRAAPATVPVTVSVPATTTPRTYDVTLTATTASGGSVSGTGTLTVAPPGPAPVPAPAPRPPAPTPAAKPTVQLGKVRLNRRRGTATVAVTVSEAGTLAVAGRTVRSVKRTASGPGSLKIAIRAKGKAKRALAKRGKAKVRARFSFTALTGATASISRSFTLKRAKKHRAKRHKRGS